MRPPAEAIGSLAVIVGGIALLILVGVEAALVYAAWRYRAARVAGPVRQTYGHTRLEVAWTIAPAVVLAVVFAFMLATMVEITGATPAGEPVLRVKAIGHQWWWEYRYGDVVSANELHIPVGTIVDLELSSADVIHSFWVPPLAGKIDMIPGQTNRLRLFARAPGTFEGQCAEFCGVEHAWMRIRVVALTREDYERWLANESRGASQGGEGERVFMANICVSCHTVRGTAAAGTSGPDLTHVGARATLGAGVLPNDVAAMRGWLADPQHFKPGSFMPRVPLSDADLDALAAYLGSLK